MKPKCIAFDFDFTLAYFADDYKGLYAIFERFGIGKNAVSSAYKELRQRGITIESLLKTAKKISTSELDHTGEAELIKKCHEWISSSLTCYPEVMHTLSRVRMHVPVAIITFGNTGFQEEKAVITGVPHDGIYVTEVWRGKPKTLQERIAQYGKPIIYVDDRASELDSVRSYGLSEGDVITILLKRAQGSNPYSNEKAVYPHKVIENLSEVLELLEE